MALVLCTLFEERKEEGGNWCWRGWCALPHFHLCRPLYPPSNHTTHLTFISDVFTQLTKQVAIIGGRELAKVAAAEEARLAAELAAAAGGSGGDAHPFNHADAALEAHAPMRSSSPQLLPIPGTETGMGHGSGDGGVEAKGEPLSDADVAPGTPPQVARTRGAAAGEQQQLQQTGGGNVEGGTGAESPGKGGTMRKMSQYEVC